MTKGRMEFLVNEVNSLTKKKEEMKLNNVPLWHWPRKEGKLIKMYVDEIALLKKQNNKEELEMDTHKEVELVETFIKRLNKREKEREEEMMNKRKEIDFTKEETKEESKMDRVPTELELLEELKGNLNNKEETKMTTNNKKELIATKGLVIAVNQLATSNLLGDESKRLSLVVQEVAEALVAIEKSGKEVDKLKERVTKKLGNETYKSIIKRGGNRKVFNKVWKNVTTVANQYYLNNKEEAKMKMNLQFFASKEEEESTMLEQVKRFNDIAKTIEEIDAVGGDVYVSGVKISWEAVKQFMYGLDDNELNLLAYSNHPAIPAELEAFAIYLLEAEKAWDNELTMQNAYFNSKKNISMDLQFFGSKKEEKIEIKDVETNEIGNAHITDQGSSYLVEPYMIETDGEGNISYRYYPSYTLPKEMGGYEYTLYFQEIDEEIEMKNTNKEELEMNRDFEEEVKLVNQEEDENMIEMNLQFFAKGETKEKRISEGHTLALIQIENLEEQKEYLLSFLDGKKEDELTDYIQQELCNVEWSIKRWSSIHNNSLKSRVREGAIKLGRGYE